jgi:hypothetical protein
VPRRIALEQHDELEDEVEDAASDQLWNLADWIVVHVPSRQGERNDLVPEGAKSTLTMLAKRRDRSVAWLRRMRKVADATAPAASTTGSESTSSPYKRPTGTSTQPISASRS